MGKAVAARAMHAGKRVRALALVAALVCSASLDAHAQDGWTYVRCEARAINFANTSDQRYRFTSTALQVWNASSATWSSDYCRDFACTIDSSVVAWRSTYNGNNWAIYRRTGAYEERWSNGLTLTGTCVQTEPPSVPAQRF